MCERYKVRAVRIFAYLINVEVQGRPARGWRGKEEGGGGRVGREERGNANLLIRLAKSRIRCGCQLITPSMIYSRPLVCASAPHCCREKIQIVVQIRIPGCRSSFSLLHSAVSLQFVLLDNKFSFLYRLHCFSFITYEFVLLYDGFKYRLWKISSFSSSIRLPWQDLKKN